MTVKLLNEQHLEFLSLTRGCTGSSESTLGKMPLVGNHMSRHIIVFVLRVFDPVLKTVGFATQT